MVSILPQLLVNGLIAGAIYALAASGFSLVYYVIKFLNFAHGGIITFGAYFTFMFISMLGFSFLASVFFSILLCIALMMVLNFLVFRQLRERKSTNIVTMISSLSLLIFLSALALALFGSSTKKIEFTSKIFDLGTFTMTSLQLIIILCSMSLFVLLWFIMKKTRIGKAMRALSDNKDVSRIVGINPEKVYNYVFIISAVLGAVSGILIGMEQNIYPRMGILLIVKGFISSVIGGITSVPGAIVGGFLIGIVENIAVWFIPSGYRDVVSFAILLIFLIFRPRGIMGAKMRDDA
jgi:branched-chain amino acid transport system permease protein